MYAGTAHASLQRVDSWTKIRYAATCRSTDSVRTFPAVLDQERTMSSMWNVNGDSVAIDGYDVVAYFDQHESDSYQ